MENSIAASTQEYSLEADFCHYSYFGGRTNSQVMRKLLVDVESPRWRFRICGDGEDRLLYEAWYDGLNCWSLIPYQAGEARPRYAGGVQDNPQVEATVFVTKNNLPQIVPGLGVLFAWFVFIPNNASNLITGNRFRCIWDDWLLCSHDVSFSIIVKSNSTATDLSKSWSWWNDGKIRLDSDFGGISQIEWPTPFQRGFTNAVCEAIYGSNGGTDCPAMATLVSYAPNCLEEATDKRILEEDGFSAKVKRISRGFVGREMQIVLPPMTRVIDCRLAEVDPKFKPSMIMTNGGPGELIGMAQLLEEHDRLGKQTGRDSVPLNGGHFNRVRLQLACGALLVMAVLLKRSFGRFRI